MSINTRTDGKMSSIFDTDTLARFGNNAYVITDIFNVVLDYILKHLEQPGRIV